MKSTSIQVGGDTAHVAKYAKVLDACKQPIRGLWERNGRFYAQLMIGEFPDGRKNAAGSVGG